MHQILSAQDNAYLLWLKGSLSSCTLDWCVNITIAPQEQDETFLISLTIDAASFRDFLDQFQALELTVLPNYIAKIQPGYRSSMLTD